MALARFYPQPQATANESGSRALMLAIRGQSAPGAELGEIALVEVTKVEALRQHEDINLTSRKPAQCDLAQPLECRATSEFLLKEHHVVPVLVVNHWDSPVAKLNPQIVGSSDS